MHLEFICAGGCSEGLSRALSGWGLRIAGREKGYGAGPARPATIESIRQVVEHKNSPSNPLGMIAGGLIGGGIGSLFGGGNGRTAATIVGALGGGYIGHNIQNSQTQTVWEIGVKYDNGSWGTIRQTAFP